MAITTRDGLTATTSVEPLALSPEDVGESHPPLTVVNRLPPREVARAALVLAGVILGLYLLWRIQEVVLLMFLAVLLATAIEPLVNQLRRGPLSRGAGVLVVYTAIIAGIAIPAYLFIPSFVGQAGAFADSLPDRLLALRGYAEMLRPAAAGQAAATTIDRIGGSLQSPAAPPQEEIVAAGATAAHTIISFVSVFVLAYYWLVERATIRRVALRSVPAYQARQVNTVWLEIEEKLGGWVRGQLILMLAVGCAATLGFVVAGLPNPIVLGVAAGLFEIVPMLGPVLAFAPAVLVALTL